VRHAGVVLNADTLDVHVHAGRLRRLLESYGYSVASVGSASGNLVTVVAPPTARPERISAGGLNLDPELQLLAFEGRIVRLTASETSVLHALLLRAGTIVPQRELIAALWADLDPAMCKNRLYAHVFTLRRKLAQACTAAAIHGSRSGYRLALKAA
jgi:DNA-binding response OmpR family regulator